MSTFNEYLAKETLSDAEFVDALKACNFSDEGQVKKLITSTHTPMKLGKAVAEKHFMVNGAYDYFTNFFGTEVWDDGQGQDMTRELYHTPNLGYDFSLFIKTMQICDPAVADECRMDYEQLPEGGRSALPPMEMYRWGVQTPRQCIANMRHIRDYEEWGKRLARGWQATDEQIQNMFFMFAALRLAGHKLVLQGVRDTQDGGVYPVASNDPKNPFQMFLHNYQEPMFPSVIDTDLIVPMEFQYLEQLARHWAHSGGDHAIGENSRGDKIYELWYPEDWFRQYAIRNPEYFAAIKEIMPAKLLSGYSLMNGNGQKEILGNWSMKVMPSLPRFAESTAGGLVPIDNFVNEEVEVGTRSLFAGRSYLNAPFLLAMIASPKAGTILYRPDLTTSVEGYPIMPIMGRGGWVIRNDYDKECNPELNMPYSQRRYEIGFRMDDPDASTAIIFRNTVYKTAAANECDWAPNVKVAPKEHDNYGIECGTNLRRAPQHVTEIGYDGAVYIECDAHMCGKGDGLMHRLKFTRKVENPGYLPFKNCGCGSEITVVVYDEEGDSREVSATIIETAADYGNWVDSILWIELEEALEPGECIKHAFCPEDEGDGINDNGELPFTLGENEVRALSCTEVTAGDLQFLLDGELADDLDGILITYYNALGAVIGTVTGSEQEANGARDLITVAGEGALTCNDEATYTTLTALFD
jgi:hypothetical protein